MVLHQEEEEIVLEETAKRSDKRGSFGDRGKENPFPKTAALKAQRKIANVATKDILLKYD